MSKISNTTVYPNIIPQAEDFVILTDVSDSDATKTCTVDGLSEYFGIKTVEIILKPSDILNIVTTPVVLVTAPAPDEFIIPTSWAMQIIFNNVAYDFSPSDYIYLTTTTGGPNSFLGLRGGTFNVGYDSVMGGSTAYNGMGQSATSENLILWGVPPTAPATQGDSDIKLNIQYRIAKFT